MRKLLGSFIFIFCMMFILQACSTGGSSSEANNEGKNGADGGSDEVLIIAKKYDASNLDPQFIVENDTADLLYQKVYETIVKPNEDMEPQPNLATEWKTIDDVTWEFTLREDVQFHDGTPFNAEAVKATYDRVLDPEIGSPQADKFTMIDEVEVVDDYLVRIHLKYPYAPLLSILGSQEAGIHNPTFINDESIDLKTVANGTGPFTFENWTSGQGITLKRNEDYWGDLPQVSGIEIKVVPEDATRLSMVENGEAHIMDQIPVNEIDRIENSQDINIHRSKGLGVEFIGFSNRKAPVDNELVRKAISYAIDREPMIEGVYNNVGFLTNSAMTPKVFGYDESIEPYPYDPEKAKELLEEADFDFNQKLTLLTPDRAQRINLAEVVQSQLKGIGVDIEIQVLELGAYLAAINDEEGHLFNGAWGNVTGDGDYNQYNLFHTDSFGDAGNWQYYSNKEVDKLIEEARAEVDDDKRKEFYAKSQKIIQEDAAFIPMIGVENMAAYHSSVSGLETWSAGYFKLDDVKITP